MSVKKFGSLLHEAKFRKNDKKWFPKWIRRYASAINVVAGDLSVTEAEVIAFSRSLRDRGLPAWQRLQAVRAIEAYRTLVLQTDVPSLGRIRQTLSRIADRERGDGQGVGSPGIRDERHLIGRIDRLRLWVNQRSLSAMDELPLGSTRAWLV